MTDAEVEALLFKGSGPKRAPSSRAGLPVDGLFGGVGALVPILLTSLTAIGELIPLALGRSLRMLSCGGIMIT
jgi:hypothetical protein